MSAPLLARVNTKASELSSPPSPAMMYGMKAFPPDLLSLLKILEICDIVFIIIFKV
jgi:hypothetical protein